MMLRRRFSHHVRGQRASGFGLVAVIAAAFFVVTMMAIMVTSADGWFRRDRLESDRMIERQMIDSAAAWIRLHPKEVATIPDTTTLSLPTAALLPSNRDGTISIRRDAATGRIMIRVTVERRDGKTFAQTATVSPT